MIRFNQKPDLQSVRENLTPLWVVHVCAGPQRTDTVPPETENTRGVDMMITVPAPVERAAFWEHRSAL